ncbi:MAG: large-conductance mechanosensitive channel protein MscL [Bacteroidia bacterium]
MGFIKEFKEFAIKGNLIDIAVGFVMGAAFGKLTTAFIDGMVMPIVGNLLSGTDFKEMRYILKAGTPETKDASGAVVAAVSEVSVKYGEFINVTIDFIIVAFVMFMVVKAINKMKKQEAEAPAGPPAPTKEEALLTEIRDLLKK